MTHVWILKDGNGTPRFVSPSKERMIEHLEPYLSRFWDNLSLKLEEVSDGLVLVTCQNNRGVEYYLSEIEYLA